MWLSTDWCCSVTEWKTLSYQMKIARKILNLFWTDDEIFKDIKGTFSVVFEDASCFKSRFLHQNFSASVNLIGWDQTPNFSALRLVYFKSGVFIFINNV